MTVGCIIMSPFIDARMKLSLLGARLLEEDHLEHDESGSVIESIELVEIKKIKYLLKLCELDSKRISEILDDLIELEKSIINDGLDPGKVFLYKNIITKLEVHNIFQRGWEIKDKLSSSVLDDLLRWKSLDYGENEHSTDDEKLSEMKSELIDLSINEIGDGTHNYSDILKYTIDEIESNSYEGISNALMEFISSFNRVLTQVNTVITTTEIIDNIIKREQEKINRYSDSLSDSSRRRDLTLK